MTRRYPLGCRRFNSYCKKPRSVPALLETSRLQKL
ncbi:hypothetical protein OIU78_013890, partial [Salix suchowensis]